jgi:hypothetical protein
LSLTGNSADQIDIVRRNLRRTIYIGSRPLFAGFRRRKINCDEALAFHTGEAFLLGSHSPGATNKKPRLSGALRYNKHGETARGTCGLEIGPQGAPT